MRKALLSIMLFLFIAGCRTVPFQDTEYVPMEPGDPWSIVEHSKARTPDNFQLLTTVVFEYNSRAFSGIGTVKINRPDRIFRAAAMSPMGVKLFEFSGDQNSVTTHYVIADLSRYGDFAVAVGDDIRRIYIDLFPDPQAEVRRSRNKLIFRQSSGPGYVEYVFAGAGRDLVEKNYYDDDGIVWRASYYEYRDQDGMRWPKGIVFVHYLHGYRLIIRQKELHT